MMENSLIIALLASLTVNILMFWYMRRVLPRVLFISRNLTDLTTMVTIYRNHLKTIHGMEMYYGDETIMYLISHTNSLLEVLEDYENEALLIEPQEYDPDYEQQEQGENENAEEKIINKENVFYAGSRRRDN